MCQSRPLFVYFRSFHIPMFNLNYVNQKSVDGELGIRTRGHWMVDANPGLFFVYSCSFHIPMFNLNYVNQKSVDGVLGIRIRDRWVVGADDSTELWWPP